VSKTKNNDFPLANYTDELAERLRTLVSAALHEGDVNAIHQARVTTRRLRAAMDLLRPVIPPKARKPVTKTLKRLRKQLGPLRDADVMLSHLDDLKRYPKHAAAINWMEKHLQIHREEALKKALSDTPPAKTLAKLGSWWGVREQIASAREQVDLLLAHSLHRQLDDFTAAADPLLNQSDKTAPAANPHAIRIAGKLLRYTVEMAEVEGHELPKNVLRSFKKMQEALGTWHDFVVFTETAMELSVEQILPATDAAMQQRVLDLCALAIRRAQSYLAKFVDLWKSRGEEISDAIRAAFPDPREIIEPKTDRDLPGSTELPAPAISDAARPAAF
jgi:CHAD domain-containing protein